MDVENYFHISLFDKCDNNTTPLCQFNTIHGQIHKWQQTIQRSQMPTKEWFTNNVKA